MLLERGAILRAHDPIALSKRIAQKALERFVPDISQYKETLTYHNDMYEALQGADGLVICTDHDSFKSPDFEKMRISLKIPAIFDGRNLYDPRRMAKLGFDYRSIGRPPVLRH